jgi:hypothetical protein
MPHRKKKSVDEGRPPKRRAANRRKAQRDPISQMYAERQGEWPSARSKAPRKKAGGRRTRSGPAKTQRGKNTASAKRATQRPA